MKLKAYGAIIWHNLRELFRRTRTQTFFLKKGDQIISVSITTKGKATITLSDNEGNTWTRV